MSAADSHDEQPLPPGWSRPLPEHVPEPTVTPATVAFGASLLLWGVVTSPIISGAGFIVFAAGLTRWIQLIRHDRKS